MKKYRLFLTALFCLAWVIPTHAQTEWQVLSPITCTRATGEPVTESFSFSALGGTATLEITNGGLTDDDIEKVGSSTFYLNGELVCGPKDFNQNIDSIVKQTTLLNGPNELNVCLKGKPGGQVTFKITQEVAEITPEISIVQTSNALKVGNIDFALGGFYPDEKRKNILYSINNSALNDLASFFENAECIEETDIMRSCEYSWTDESGEDSASFYMVKDVNGKWLIMSW